MQCDIIIPVWNQLNFTKDCIRSILDNTTDVDYRLIIVDNASDDDTKKYLTSLNDKKRPQVSIIRNDKNLGFVKAVNQGIAISTSSFICVLNNDTVTTKSWLKAMIDVAEIERTIGIVNPSSNSLGQRPAKGEPIELYVATLKKETKKFIELGAAIGFCMLIKREVIQKIGVFDEIYGMGNFEDTDLSRRAIKEGYKCVRACGAYVYHRESSSFDKLETFEEGFRRNRAIFEFRWGRPKRIAYILTHYDENTLKRLNAEAIKLARSSNWIWYFSRDPINIPNHSNIRLVRLPVKWFYLKSVFMILKKKKKFDKILVGDEKLSSILNGISFIHKAKVDCY